jgi:hypothetical protein
MKNGRKQNKTMTDKERIFANIINQLSFTQMLCHGGDGYRSETYRDGRGREYVHFANSEKPVVGDLVLAKTGFVSEWKIGFYHQELCDGAVIREIGTGRLCNYTNESFVPIRGMSRIDLLEGEDYQFYRRVLLAFGKGREYNYRFSNIVFHEGGLVSVFVREAFGGFRRDCESIPFEIKFEWNKKMTVKRILEVLREGGYGTKEFETKEIEK